MDLSGFLRMNNTKLCRIIQIDLFVEVSNSTTIAPPIPIITTINAYNQPHDFCVSGKSAEV